MSYHDHKSSQSGPRPAKDDNPHDRLFYVYLLGAAVFVLMVWTVCEFFKGTAPAAGLIN